VPQAGEQDPVVTGRSNAGFLIVDQLYSNTTTTVGTALTLTDQATAPSTPASGSIVYSMAGSPAFKDSSGNVTTLKNSDPTASDSLLAAWAFDPSVAAGTFLTTAGVLYLVKVILPAAQTITNGLVSVTTAGGTLTTAQNWIALYTATGTRVAVSADQTTAFASAGLITAAFTSPYAAAAGAYYVGVLCNGSTAVTLASGSALKPGNVAIGNAGLATATSRYLTSGTGATVTPTSVTMASASGNVAANIWAAIS